MVWLPRVASRRVDLVPRAQSSLKFALAQNEDQSMKRKRLRKKVVGILKEHEVVIPVADLCRKHDVSDASIYKLEGQVRRDARAVAGGREHEAQAGSGRRHAG